MTSRIIGLALFALLSAQLTLGAAHKKERASVVVQSSAHLARVSDHSSGKSSSFIRREERAGPARIRQQAAPSAGDEDGDDGTVKGDEDGDDGTVKGDGDGDDGTVKGGGLLQKQSAMATGQAAFRQRRSVTWNSCPGDVCSCAAARRRVVIRFRREENSGFPALEVAVQTNWFYRVGQHGTTYNSTPPAEFNKGFIGQAAITMGKCGGDSDNALDCTVAPVTCSFQTATGDEQNTYDAKEGEYCCSADRKYCSYKCKPDGEAFHCASATDNNFPGGLDPLGPKVHKKCYWAQYPHGSNPDHATDADEDKLPDEG